MGVNTINIGIDNVWIEVAYARRLKMGEFV